VLRICDLENRRKDPNLCSLANVPLFSGGRIQENEESTVEQTEPVVQHHGRQARRSLWR
jgi:hypothetical protein